MSREGAGDEALQHRRVGDSRLADHLGVAAELGKAGKGVELVDVNLPPGLAVEEIHPREPRAAQRRERGPGLGLHLAHDPLVEIGGDDDLRFSGRVFGLVVVPPLPGEDFGEGSGQGLIALGVLEDGALKLPAVCLLLDEHLEIVG